MEMILRKLKRTAMMNNKICVALVMYYFYDSFDCFDDLAIL